MPVMRCHKNKKLGKTDQADDEFAQNEILRRRQVLGKTNIRLGRPPKWLFPDPVESEYRRILFSLVDVMIANTEKILFPNLEGIVREYNASRGIFDSAAVRMDGWADNLDRLIGDLEINITSDNPINNPSAMALDIGQKTSSWNDTQWRKTMKRVLGVDVFLREPWLNELVVSFSKENVALINSMTSDYIQGMRSTIQRGVKGGFRASTIEKEIRDRFTFKPVEPTRASRSGVRIVNPRKRAKLIARDQVAKLNSQITSNRQQAVGIEKYIWRTSLDERVRPSHEEKEGETFSWNDPPSDTGHPGEDIQCIPGDSKINLLAGCQKLYRRWYSGELTTFISASGASFQTTPNHPILTQRGWLPANFVNMGDYIIQAMFNDSFSLLHYVNNQEISIKEIFDFFNLPKLVMWKPGIGSQFHGDGRSDNKIDIINVDSFLPGELDVVANEKVAKIFFTIADKTFSNFGFFTNGQGFEVLNRFFESSDRLVCSMSNLFSFIIRHSLKPDDISFTAISDFYANFVQASPDHCPAYFDFDGNRKLTDSGKIECFDFIKRQFYFIIGSMMFSDSGINSPTSKELGEMVGVNRKSFPNSFKGGSFIYHPFRFIKKISSNFSGHVYNLQTKSSWFNINNGIVIHNCRCTAEPVFTKELLQV